MKVDSLFCYVPSCWFFPNQIASSNVLNIFESLTMNRGALTWVHNFWSYDAKVIDYWTILLVKLIKSWKKLYLNPKVYLVLLESSCWVKFNEVYFIIFILKVWKILNLEWIFLVKLQTNYKKIGFRRENELSVFPLGANNTCYIIYPWRKVVCFVLS